jgi:hypothetical protein
MIPMTRWLRTTMHPDWYQGHNRKPPYFEGWYFKMIDPTTRHKLVVIPAIFKSSDPHAFIQVMDGSTSESWYHRYPIDQFWAASDRFSIRVGENTFTKDEINLNIDLPEQKIQGKLKFSGQVSWPVSVKSPGIMGWYAWVPTMECYHGVVSLDHVIEGSLTWDGRVVDFSGGRGYIEKDWGQSFPSAWIWMQSNHFEEAGTSLTASIAMIPWRRTRFRGFIVGLWHQRVLYRFATYTGAETLSLKLDDKKIDWVMQGKTAGGLHWLNIHAERGEAGILAGPSTVDMGKRVAESLTAVLSIKLTHVHSGGERTVIEDTGRFGGLEVHNVFEELLSV